MEAPVSDDEDDEVILLVCTNSSDDHPNEEILVSITDILVSDLSTFLNFHTIKLHAHRNRLIQHSFYFRGLLSGSFR